MQPTVTPIYVPDLWGDLNSSVLVACLRFVTLQLIFTYHLHIQLISEDLWLQCVREVLIFLQIFSDCCSQPSRPCGSWL